MPGGNGTGPAGYGPMTGRKRGYCAGSNRPGFMNGTAYGRGLAHRRGCGRGFGRNFRRFSGRNVGEPVYDNSKSFREDKVNYLKDTAQALEDELKQVKEQLNKLEDNDTDQ